MSETKTFFGVPVTGDYTTGSTRVEQKPIEELAPLFQVVMEDPTIVEFGWRQYTPYFNDGDPCEFGAYGLWVKTTTEVENEEAGVEEYGVYDLDVDYHPSLGRIEYGYNDERRYVALGYEGPDEERFNRCQALDRALQSGAFDHVLLEEFGDHARITVRQDNIEVEYYEHD